MVAWESSWTTTIPTMRCDVGDTQSHLFAAESTVFSSLSSRAVTDMYPRSVITLLGDDREDVCGTVLFNLWKERFSTSSSVYILEPPGPYFRAPTQQDGTSQLTPNLTVVNPQLKRWRLPDSNGLDEMSLSSLWSGPSLTINRPANFEGENSESSSTAMVRESPLTLPCVRSRLS